MSYTKLEQTRKLRKISQAELSQMAGVSQSQISKIEKGTTEKPSHDKLVRIAEALNCRIADFMDEDPNVQPLFNSFTQSGEALFIPLFAEKQPMNQTFNKGEGFVLRSSEATQTQIRKPSFLTYSEKAYACINFGTSMSPRYRAGDTLFVDPTLDVEAGDDVVLMFQLPDRIVGIIRELDSFDDEAITARDLASSKAHKINRADLYAVHVVVGSQRKRGGA